MGKVADILQARGELDEALRIRQEEELPVYERLGDVREKAVTMGKVADILQARGELERCASAISHCGTRWEKSLQARGELEGASARRTAAGL
jgi:hypothetical protein